MSKTRKLAAAYADHKHAQAVEAWVVQFHVGDEQLPLKPQHTLGKGKSRSDRRTGLNGKVHRIGRATRALRITVSNDRERDFATAEERKLRMHRTHHLALAQAKVRSVLQQATAAIQQYAYGLLPNI